MIKAISRHQARRSEAQAGFTLIELLVVIVILGILAAVVVFAVSGVGDKGKAASYSIDARTIRTAEEAFCAQNGRYGEADELVAGGFLSELPVYHLVATAFADNPADGCKGSGDLSKAAFFVTCRADQEGCGGGGALALSWKSQNPNTTEVLNGVHFRDRKNGWAVGGNNFGGTPTVRRTTDGGTTWIPATVTGATPNEFLWQVDFVDTDPPATARGWAVSEFANIYSTTDGGSTWAIQYTETNGLPLIAIDVVDANNAWAVGVLGVVLKWNGTAWTELRPPDFVNFEGTLNDVQFLDANRGWAVGERRPSSAPPDDGNVLITDDGGVTWLSASVGTSVLFAVSFVSATKGWTTGSNQVFTTNDGGFTWIPQPPAPGDRLAIEFVNARQGWTGGLSPDGIVPLSRSALTSTQDGGNSYTIDVLPVNNKPVRGIDFVDAAHGWIVSNRAILAFGPPTS